jgi:peptidoglycan/LPS O-acetylase OafA/YrhL
MLSLGFSFVAMTATGLLCLTLWSSHCARLFGFRPLVYLGRISYGVYLLQMPANFIGQWLFGLPERSGVSFTFTVALSVALASLSWYVMERVVMAWARRLRLPAPQAVPVSGDGRKTCKRRRGDAGLLALHNAPSPDACLLNKNSGTRLGIMPCSRLC